MTNKEALSAKVQCPVSDSTLEVALLDRGVIAGDNYTVANKQQVELAVMDVLFMIFTQPDITEGDYSVSHPNFREKIKERLLQLATLNEATEILDLLVEAKPTITSKAVW